MERSNHRGRRLVVAAIVPIQPVFVLLLSGRSMLDFYAIALGRSGCDGAACVDEGES